ncbi:MAG: undecaprenyl-diphosphate phosphatase [Porticoccaceae bacterium]
MSLFQVVVLAIIQGVTEFLPISSSAHLILPSALLGWPDQGLAFDVAVHVGTLIAVVSYFRKDLTILVRAWCSQCFRGNSSAEGRLGWFIILATIPAGIAGLLFDNFIETHLRSVLVIALTTIAFGLLLGFADKRPTKIKTLDALEWKQALIIGIAQALALIPGTSRSGITMTAALALGFDRVTAARFSFLLSIPVIILSGGFKTVELLGATAVPWGQISLAISLSAITAYGCIYTFLAWINRMGMMPFVWYRVLLGAVLLLLLATGQV